MPWSLANLVSKGKVRPPQGMCPACGADLVPKLVEKGRKCFFTCSEKGCKYWMRAVPPSSKPYSGRFKDV